MRIPMGTNRSPFLTSPFLYFSESKFMVNINKDTSTFHLIDELVNTVVALMMFLRWALLIF